MIKIGIPTIFLFIAFFFFSSPQAAEAASQTRIVDSYTTVESTGEILLHRTVVLPNLETGKPEVYTQILRKNPDGSLSTIPTMITDKVKKRREKRCAMMGGTDVTDEGVARISPTMIEIFSCKLPTKQDSISSNATPKTPTRRKSSELTKPYALDGIGVITYIEGTGTKYGLPGRNVLLTASYTVSYFRGSVSVNYFLQSDLCRYGGQEHWGGDSGSGSMAWGGRCLIRSGTSPGTRFGTYAQACTSSGSCKSEWGAVIVQ